eukprot:CAMPEP_0172516306 /NCGR_PEP_ID=MMETSP1066-20121228/275182_1 /TAXON_ID=671091 /ORGANISM="Coscinodiscus wailesii, Strain CCMP2513" /LENGTH=574 /DNA_ID=CAMNT_0013297727 /DNA_START=414 /DNA_END=2138 /DNA_ORIENTATION=+
MNVTHTRFEHSLGVMYLAEKLCRRIRERQPRLGVTEKDVLCVKLAGLCHDLGHGPYSHVFETLGWDDGWEHEEASLFMIDAALEHLGLRINEDDLDSPLEQIGDGLDALNFGVFCGNDEGIFSGGISDAVLTSRDLIFVKECILGGPLKGKSELVGRPEIRKEFLYDIVSNRHSGLDVDKLDYYARDMRRALGVGQVDQMFVEEAFVAWGKCPKPKECFRCRNEKHNNNSGVGTFRRRDGMANEHLMIAYPEKLVNKAMEFFKTRFSLHAKVYTHKTSKATELMVRDIFTLADPYVEIPVEDANEKRTVKISQAIHDPKAYVNLQDSIIDHIYLLRRKELEPAQELIRRLKARRLYKCVLTQPIRSNDQNHQRMWRKNEDDIAMELVRTINGARCEDTFQKKFIKVEKRSIHHGRKEDNPVNLMRFLPKRELSLLDNPVLDLPLAKRVDEEDYASHIPRVFLDRTIRVFCTVEDDETRELVKLGFETMIHDSPAMTSLTPMKPNESVLLSQDTSDTSGGRYDNDVERTPPMFVAAATATFAKRKRADSCSNYDYSDDDNDGIARKQSRVVRSIL